MTIRMTIEDQSHEILVKIWLQFITIIYDAHMMLVRQGYDKSRSVYDLIWSHMISTMTFPSALDFEHEQNFYDGLTLEDDL